MHRSPAAELPGPALPHSHGVSYMSMQDHQLQPAPATAQQIKLACKAWQAKSTFLSTQPSLLRHFRAWARLGSDLLMLMLDFAGPTGIRDEISFSIRVHETTQGL